MRTEKKDKVVTNSHGQISLFADNNGLTINSFFTEPVIPETKKVVEKYLSDLSLLKTGDKIRVELSYGMKSTFEGYFTTKGFRDGRDQGNFEYYYMEIINEDENAPRKFKNFSPRCKVEVLESFETTGYTPPDKSLVKEKLKERLEGQPTEKLTVLYQNFQDEYPHLSYEWSGVLYKAWNEILPTVVSEEDAFELFKNSNKNSGRKLPVPIKKTLKAVFNNYVGEERVEQLNELRWLENRKESFDKEIKGDYCRFNETNNTYYRTLVEYCINHTKNEKLFIEALTYKWYQSQFVVEGDNIHYENEEIDKNYIIWKSKEWQKTSFVPYMMRNQQNYKVS